MTKLASAPLQDSNLLPETSLDPRPPSVTAVVVDASCFSLPYDYSLCDALARDGHRIVLARSEFRGTQWKRSANGFEVWNHFYHASHKKKSGALSRAVGKVMKAAEHLSDMRKFVSRVRELQPDFIHFQWLPAPLLDGLYLKDLNAIAPLVLTVHNTSPHGTVMQRFHQKFGWASAFDHFQAVIVHSEFSRRRIVERNWAPADRIHVIPHGVLDYYLGLENNDSVRPPSNQMVVMFFGCVEPYKGLDVLIRAFALLPANVRAQTQLLIAGTPNMDAAPLRKLARDLGIEPQMVWRLNYIAEDEVPHLFRSAALVVLPYRAIDQSGVLMTAVAFGKAIVASRIGGIPDVISDGVHGVLVKPGDPQDLAAALQDLLTNPVRRHAMEKATGHLAKTELSWGMSARKTIDVYRQVISNAAASRTARVVQAR